MMINKLIINADDYGLTRAVTRGILTLLASRKITNTTAMMCVPGSIDLQSEFRREVDSSKIGVHLQLTSGEPIVKKNKSSLITEGTNEFRPKAEFLLLDPKDVYQEWVGQVQLFISLYGHRPSHIDSHHGPHQWEHLLPVYCEVAKLFNLPVRGGNQKTRGLLSKHNIKHCNFTLDNWTGKGLEKAVLLDYITALFQEENIRSIEVESHPGFVDEDLMRRSSLNTLREKELHELNLIEKNDLLNIGVDLISYEELP
jgi:Uncharacterized protein conserved in bacteria